MWYLILLLTSSLAGCANRYSEECFYRVGQGALRMSLWNQWGGGPKKFVNRCHKKLENQFALSVYCKVKESRESVKQNLMCACVVQCCDVSLLDCDAVVAHSRQRRVI
jgi:hypothetical protein